MEEDWSSGSKLDLSSRNIRALSTTFRCKSLDGPVGLPEAWRSYKVALQSMPSISLRFSGTMLHLRIAVLGHQQAQPCLYA